MPGENSVALDDPKFPILQRTGSGVKSRLTSLNSSDGLGSWTAFSGRIISYRTIAGVDVPEQSYVLNDEALLAKALPGRRLEERSPLELGALTHNLWLRDFDVELAGRVNDV
jgi:hypothetical protein